MSKTVLSKLRLLFIVLVFTALSFFGFYHFRGDDADVLLHKHARTQEQKFDLPTKAGSVNLVSITSSTTSETTNENKRRFNSEVELCQGFSQDKKGELNPAEYFGQLLNYLQTSDHSVEEWLRSVATTGTPRQRAAALSLLLIVSTKAVVNRAHHLNAKCDEDPQCSENLRIAMIERTSADQATLINLAVYNSDPMLYGVAYNTCLSGMLVGANLCTRLDAAQWMQRDPENGAAARYALAAMKIPGPGEDGTAFENALYRLSLSKRFEYYVDVATALPPLPASFDDYQHRTELSAWIYEYLMMLPMPPTKHISAACNEEAVKKLHRRSICTSIANQLLRDDVSMFDRALFLKLSSQLEWDREALQKITDEFDMVRAYFREIMRREARQLQQSSGQVTACYMSLNNMNKNLSNLKKGEFSTYRDEAKSFDISREELIKMGRGMRQPKQ